MTAVSTEDDEGMLAELAAALVRDCRSLQILGWPEELLERCLDAVDHLADEAARRRFPEIRQGSLDLYAYLVGVVERQPTLASRGGDFPPLVERLADAVSRDLAIGARSLACIDLLSPREQFPPALTAAFEHAGYVLRRFTEAAQLEEASRLTPAAALFVDASLLRDACAVLDGLSAQVPASGNTVVVAFGGDGASDRLDLLLQGATLHARRLVEEGLATRVLELLQHSRDQPYRVLVVDDDANSREYLRLVLGQGGIEVELCADPSEVVARLAANPPDLLLLDLHMPGIDGLSLTLRLRRRPEHALLPILLISGEEREQVRSQAIQSGADDFLSKPVRPRVLLAEVRSRIKRARLVRQQLPAASRVAHEALSGQLRRGDFLNQLAQAMREPGPGWLALLSIKVDQADALGKSLGQSASYALEQAIAARLSAELGSEDAYTLWLEFGFGVLARRESREELQALASRLCQAVARRPFEEPDVPPQSLTVSIGLALPPAHAGANPDRWFAAAYAAMSIAHRLGGNRHDGVLSREHGDIPAERVLLIRELVKDAARGEHIVNEFQPMLPLQAGDGGAYALSTKLRDYRAPLSGIGRDEYLAAARESGSLAMIERAGLFSAFEAIQAEREQGRRTLLLAPVDLGSLENAQLAWLAAERRRRGAAADCLVLEVAASDLLAKPHLVPVMQQLRDLGLRLAIADDSGGLSRVERLLPMPADLLRLPQAAIDGVPPDAFAALVKAWRASGRGLIVDSVRNLDTVQDLWSLGVDYLLGDALAASGPRLDYDFGQVSLASGTH
jgi:PleD family two-component response regulator/EAL domain-containing protein (putative c-di-GMP-specific phosphodiesterase class I)